MSKDSHPLDWGTASFQEAIAQGPVEVTFDLWKGPDGQPFVFWVWPITVEELDTISKAADRRGVESHIETVMQRCRTKDGARVFQNGHRARLKKETNGDHLVLLSSLINRAVPPPVFDLEAALKR